MSEFTYCTRPSVYPLSVYLSVCFIPSLPPSLPLLHCTALQQHFSQDMQHVVTTLLSGKAAASQVCRLISERINEEFDSAMAASDALHR